MRLFGISEKKITAEDAEDTENQILCGLSVLCGLVSSSDTKRRIACGH
jgi:hypothetical protein